MRLLELFNTVHSLRELDLDETNALFGQEGVAAAFEFAGPSGNVIIYFSYHDKGLDGFVHCNFATLKGPGKLNYMPTGTGGEFAVYSAVAQAIREFIVEHQPRGIHIDGYIRSQTALYAKALRRVDIPPPYLVYHAPEDESGFYIANVMDAERLGLERFK